MQITSVGPRPGTSPSRSIPQKPYSKGHSIIPNFDSSTWVTLIAIVVLCAYGAALQYLDMLPNIKQHLTQTTAEHGPLLLQTTAHPERSLRFQVCNGFANQRLAIMYAALIAKKTDRTLVLPQLIGTGTQLGEASSQETEENSVPFESVYDVDTFVAAMGGMGLDVVPGSHAPPPSNYTHTSLQQVGFDGLKPVKGRSSDPHVAVDCTLFKVCVCSEMCQHSTCVTP